MTERERRETMRGVEHNKKQRPRTMERRGKVLPDTGEGTDR